MTYICISIDSGTKPIPEPILPSHLVRFCGIHLRAIWHWWGPWRCKDSGHLTRTDPRPAEGPNSFHWKKREVGSFILLRKISRTACRFGIRTFLKQYRCYESATIWYTDHQYLAQYSEIINNLPQIPLIFCNCAVHSCETWRKGPGQSPCNVLSISDLELYVTETSTGVCDPVTN